MLLPQGPIPIRLGFYFRPTLALLLAGGAGLALLVGTTVWQGGEIGAILEHAEVWTHGETAASARVRGKRRTSRFILNEYDLQVSFVDRRGGSHARQLRYSTLFGTSDTAKSPIVKYDPQKPEHFAVSWAAEAATSRWMASIVFLLLLLLVGGFLVFLAYLLGWSTIAELRAQAREPKPLRLQIVGVSDKIVNKKATGARIFQYVYEGGDPSRPGWFELPKGREPRWTDEGHTHVVALAPNRAKDTPRVLWSDGYPFRL